MDIRKIINKKRGSNLYKKIRQAQRNGGVSNYIAISKGAVAEFGECPFYEILTEQGIFLAKSGCDLSGKKEITLAVRLPNHCDRVFKPNEKYFEQIDQ